MYPSATETLTKFREDSALINGTRLENKVPVPIPKLLVQDQDLWNAGFLGTLALEIGRTRLLMRNTNTLDLSENDFNYAKFS
ncbi:unnamed protein product [Rhizophagus irregularis]|nr:unnamed protein product [Rhizophagus irregularis]